MKREEKSQSTGGHVPVGKYHYLISTRILFSIQVSETEQSEHEVPVNALITYDKPYIPAALLGKAQQAAQIQLMGKLGTDAQNTVVRDVVITNITHLGCMTDEEFKGTGGELHAAVN